MWVNDETYYRMMTANQGYEPKKVPLTDGQKQFILTNDGKMYAKDIANKLGVSRMTVWRYLKSLDND